MIPTATLNPAIDKARAQSRTARVDTSKIGMPGVLQNWKTNSPRFGANRRADGLTPIDTACAALALNWKSQGGAGMGGNDTATTTLLDACAQWLDDRKVFCMRVTGWREKAIKELYWQVAWAYISDRYVQHALATLAINNAAGMVTSIIEPTPPQTPGGDPYDFMNSGYQHQTAATLTPLYRGDTRSPTTIENLGGLMPQQLASRWDYLPFFDGSTGGNTPGLTNDPQLAINAVGAAKATGNHLDHSMDAWVESFGRGKPRGYIYEFGHLPGATSCLRVQEQTVGREVIFLGIPHAMISRWWAVHSDHTTSGPFAFPATGNPPANPGPQSAPNQLA
ncbi:hypothetical protein [Rugamonas rivuli]|uniref:Uncharacterized protein n=1 Tax=Rugamonas rivuli TaxID=2743358 RepID=A0A843S1U9_9BURK|nr:hypothetical protein [Rugamonas rivuli]MQA18069.1 hypothetical protein [Rugamonas rivuli]